MEMRELVREVLPRVALASICALLKRTGERRVIRRSNIATPGVARDSDGFSLPTNELLPKKYHLQL